MIQKIIFNVFTGKFEFSSDIPEYTSDPTSLNVGDTWVLHTDGPQVGESIGLLLSLTYSSAALGGYHLSYYTTEGNIKRVQLT